MFGFRIWSNVEKKYLEGFQFNMACINHKGEFVFPDPNWNGMTTACKKSYKIEYATGLKDKNGTMIYERDICKHTFAKFGYHPNEETLNGRVIYVPGRGRFELLAHFDLSPLGYPLATCDIDRINEDVEIIGNINENPELL